MTMVLHVCCKSSLMATQQLVQPSALPIWLNLLQPLFAEASDEDDVNNGNDCLGLLVKTVALHHGCLEQLMRCAGEMLS